VIAGGGQPSETVKLVWEGREIEVPEGSTIDAVAASQGQEGSGWEAPIAAVLDGRLVSLGNVVYSGASVRLVRAWQGAGREVYRRSLGLVIQAAVRRVLPGVRLVVGQSLGGGVFYDWHGDPPPGGDTIATLEGEMRAIVDADLPIDLVRMGEAQARKLFEDRDEEEKLLLLETWWHESVRLVKLGDHHDIRHDPVAPTTGRLARFDLIELRGGVLLRFPEPGRGREGSVSTSPPVVVDALFDVFRETKDWNRILGVSTVGELNRACLTGDIEEIVRVAEGLHEQKVVHIAEELGNRGGVRLALIAGPSSSGKTTFSKRLSVQLKVLGLNPVAVSVDDYYVDREDTPRDRSGEYDFEALEAVDLTLFNEHLADLLEGREVRIPRYDFQSGRRVPAGRFRPMRLGEADVLIVEGIHALNPRLTESVPEGDKFRIYVSALAQLCLDSANRISTTDVRLLRRLVRDRHFRGYSAAQTLAKWPSVKRGESKNIFPYQDRAHTMFNSTLVYEVAVLKTFAQRYLLEVPHGDPVFLEAYRLLKFLDIFVGISPDMVARTSIIREFIGGSHFEY